MYLHASLISLLTYVLEMMVACSSKLGSLTHNQRLRNRVAMRPGRLLLSVPPLLSLLHLLAKLGLMSLTHIAVVR